MKSTDSLKILPNTYIHTNFAQSCRFIEKNIFRLKITVKKFARMHIANGKCDL